MYIQFIKREFPKKWPVKEKGNVKKQRKKPRSKKQENFELNLLVFFFLNIASIRCLLWMLVSERPEMKRADYPEHNPKMPYKSHSRVDLKPVWEASSPAASLLILQEQLPPGSAHFHLCFPGGLTFGLFLTLPHPQACTVKQKSMNASQAHA